VNLTRLDSEFESLAHLGETAIDGRIGDPSLLPMFPVSHDYSMR
jgi:hypothetical protein